MMTMRNWWYLLFFITLLGGGGWLWVNRMPVPVQADLRTAQPAIEHPAPDFTLTTLDGERFSLADYRGKPIVLNFWATWCGPCRRELPALQAAAERYGERVLIVGVDQGEPPEEVQQFVDEFGLTFPIPLDPDLAVGADYHIQGLPTTYFIDADGLIRHLWIGEMNSITLAEGVAEILR